MAFDIFLDLTDVPGESKDATYKDKIDILSYSWGASNSGDAVAIGGMGSGKVNAQDISFSKYLDKSSPVLNLNCHTGKHIPKGKLIVRKAGEQPFEYVTLEMNDCIITSYQTGAQSGADDRIIESFSISFADFMMKYFEQDQRGAGSLAGSGGYNYKKNKKVD